MNALLRLIIVLLFFTSVDLLHAQTFVRGVVNGRWDPDNNPYVATDNLIIANGQSLTISPGVELYFEGNFVINVFGTLTAEGTEEDSIYFLPYGDRESWGGIRISNPSGPTRLTYCVISNGRAVINQRPDDVRNSGGNIYASNGNLFLKHSVISNGVSNGMGGGVGLWNTTAEITNTLFINNSTVASGGGINVRNESAVLIDGCRFIENISAWGGGGVFIEGNCNAEISNSLFLNNEGSAGAGLSIYTSEVECYKVDFIENRANTMGGGVYARGPEGRVKFEWCAFIRNVTNHNEGGGGGILIREGIEAEIIKSRFIENVSGAVGGGLFVTGEMNATLEHLLFFKNRAFDGGAAASSQEQGGIAIRFTNCTFLDNIAVGGEGQRSQLVALMRNTRLNIINSIIHNRTPLYNPMDRVLVAYTTMNVNQIGGDIVVGNPDIFEMDSTWALLKGFSSCIDSGDPDSPNDPDGTRADRGWMPYPQDAIDGVTPRDFSINMYPDELAETEILFQNTSYVPMLVTPIDQLMIEPNETLYNISRIVNDNEITSITTFAEFLVVAGANNGNLPHKIYVLDFNLELVRTFNQQGDDQISYSFMASDGRELIYAIDSTQIVSFTIEGDYVNFYNVPNYMLPVRGLTVDNKFGEHPVEVYIASEHGEILITDDDLWEIDTMPVGENIRGIAMKRNKKSMYLVYEQVEGSYLMTLYDFETRREIPLRLFDAPIVGTVWGGMDVNEYWSTNFGTFVGLWRNPQNADWLHTATSYTKWFSVEQNWKLVMPFDTVSWKVNFNTNEVLLGKYSSNVQFSVNGTGRQQNSIPLELNVIDLSASNSPELPNSSFLVETYPNPFNSELTISYNVPLASVVSFTVFNVKGELVEHFNLGKQNVGQFKFRWDASNHSSGIYFLRLNSGLVPVSMNKVVLLK